MPQQQQFNANGNAGIMMQMQDMNSNTEELNRYEAARSELMKLKFGCSGTNANAPETTGVKKEEDGLGSGKEKEKVDPFWISSFENTTTTQHPSDPEVTTTSIPNEYLKPIDNNNNTTASSPSSASKNLPYNLNFINLPKFSRQMETVG
ncbi:unnamed protein product [Ambrosiozyma monospora]|uniref:Unnamed protein product n=1 Tax=Ambrosiozyma monospora TaxID=43982 RepID=A0ACB5TZD1_AMBMO|nr:unnamed protein product [Ambrosiozyma monospora]